MAESLINDYQSTLSAQLAAGSGPGATITVASGVPAAAVGQNGRVRIGALGSLAEIVLVTFTTSTQWTVVTRAVEDSSRFPAATWLIGTPVRAVLTAGAVTAAVSTGLTLWADSVNGDDSTAVRGSFAKPYLTLAAAKAAASSGDTIQVRPGTYTVTASLAKAGVNWHFEPGATITRSDAVYGSGSGLFDDSASAITYAIDGAADLFRPLPDTLTGSSWVIRTANASSSISVRCRSINNQSSDAARVSYGVNCEAGLAYVEADFIGIELSDGGYTYPVWWSNGDMYVVAKRIVSGLGNSDDAPAVASACSTSPTGEGRVEAEEIVGNPAIAVNAGGSNTTAALWVRALIVRQIGGLGGAIKIQGGNRCYVETQKIFGSIILAGSGNLVYVRAQKWSAIANGSTPDDSLLSSPTGTVNAILDIQEANPETFTGDMFTVAAGTVEIRGMRYVANSGSKGITLSGGTLTLKNCVIDTSANNATNPITMSGGTLVLENCTLISQGTRDSIEASGARTVTVRGSLTINNAVDSNVTLSGGTVVRADLNTVGAPYFANIVYSADDFRLTTESGVSVSTSDRTSQGTIYLTPHIGNQIGLLTSGQWVLRTTAQVSLALSSLTSGKNYDVFAYWTGSAVALELSAAWSSDSSPADALAQQDGVWVKSGTTTRRHVGTIRTTSTTTTEDSAAKRFVWNRANQVPRVMNTQFVSDSHTYNTASWREWHSGTSSTRLEFVCGDSTTVQSGVASELKDGGYVGVGMDSTSSPLTTQVGNAATVLIRMGTFNMTTVAKGYHFGVVLEFGSATPATMSSYGHAMTVTM